MGKGHRGQHCRQWQDAEGNGVAVRKVSGLTIATFFIAYSAYFTGASVQNGYKKVPPRLIGKGAGAPLLFTGHPVTIAVHFNAWAVLQE